MTEPDDLTPCPAMAQQLYAYVRQELGLQEARAVEEHLEGPGGCQRCTETVRQMRALETLLTSPSLSPRAPSPGLRRRLQAAMAEPARPDLAEKPRSARPGLPREGWPEVPPPRRLPPR
jgi:anti-sigma factor RsiW